MEKITKKKQKLNTTPILKPQDLYNQDIDSDENSSVQTYRRSEDSDRFDY